MAETVSILNSIYFSQIFRKLEMPELKTYLYLIACLFWMRKLDLILSYGLDKLDKHRVIRQELVGKFQTFH